MKPDSSRKGRRDGAGRQCEVWWLDQQRHPLHKELGKIVRAARLAHGLSQAELGRLAKLSKSYICALEQGKHSVTVEILLRLEAALQLAPLMLIESAFAYWFTQQKQRQL
ncbi:MAG: helix-turn-helix transcriptional regulator [Verrucomicrobiaceae bacterium]|nr:helix-turn-helix transcriptional regulator [Verrucomicrobiaceae bacterium]